MAKCLVSRSQRILSTHVFLATAHFLNERNQLPLAVQSFQEAPNEWGVVVLSPFIVQLTSW